MSGIEVAGLVLGAFPILVSALEHYRESAQVLSNWFAFKRKYQKVKHDIEWLRFSFTQNLKELLLPLICDEEEVDVLISDPGGELWTKPELESKLKERLAGAYIHYLRAIEDVNGVMKKWMKELGLEKVDVRASKDKINFHLLRIKFALGQSTRDELFKEFKEYNGRLEDILRQGDRIQQISTAIKAPPRSISRSLKLIRKRATTLYHLLAKAWTCQCKSLHHVHLSLENKILEKSGTKFDVVFVYSQDTEHDHRPWEIKDTSIIVVEENTSIVKNPQAIAVSENTKRVTIVEDSTSHSVFSSTIIQVQPQINILPPLGRASPVSDIRDLCSTLAHPASEVNCYGRLREGDECYQFHSGGRVNSKSSADLFSLESLLQEQAQLSLRRRQRYDMAYTIALANVQLYSTPWLSKHFGKSSVVLPMDLAGSKSVTTGPPLLVQDLSNTNEAPVDINKNETLTKLGILLLELCFGKSIESSSSMNAIRTKLGLSTGLHNPLIDRIVALDWSEQVLDETGPQYAAAVDWCLKIGQTSIDTDDEWQLKVYENVVLPLQECCKLLR